MVKTRLIQNNIIKEEDNYKLKYNDFLYVVRIYIKGNYKIKYLNNYYVSLSDGINTVKIIYCD